jgi:phage baseplate assembly protein W
MTPVTAITSKDWQVRLGAPGEVVTGLADIAQCLNIILATPRGTDPLRPEFGSDLWRYLDWPMDRALPHIVRESIDAIETWEPRVEVLGVEPRLGEAAGQAIVRIVWRLAAGTAAQRTEVIL